MNRGRLQSITQQQADVQISDKTPEALLKIYHSLLCLNYTRLTIGQSRQIFSKVSEKVNTKQSIDKVMFNVFKQQDQITTKNRFNNYLQETYKNKKQKNNNFLSKEQFRQIMAQRGSPTRRHADNQSIQQHQSINQSPSMIQPQTLQQIMNKLNQFDEERSIIKSIVLSQSCPEATQIYQRWAKIHCATKQTLETYLTRISQGMSMVQLFRQISSERKLEGEVDGYSKVWLYSKLNSYLQSLYIDERQLILYNESLFESKHKSRVSLMLDNCSQNNFLSNKNIFEEQFAIITRNKVTRSFQNSRVVKKIHF